MAGEHTFPNVPRQPVPNRPLPSTVIDGLRRKWEDALMQLLALEYFLLATGRGGTAQFVELHEFVSAHHNWWWASGELGYDKVAYGPQIVEAVLGVRQFDLKRTGGVIRAVDHALDSLSSAELVIYDAIYARLYPNGLPRKKGAPVPSYRGVRLVDEIHKPPNRSDARHVVPPAPKGSEIASLSPGASSKGKSSPSETASRSSIDAPSRTTRWLSLMCTSLYGCLSGSIVNAGFAPRADSGVAEGSSAIAMTSPELRPQAARDTAHATSNDAGEAVYEMPVEESYELLNRLSLGRCLHNNACNNTIKIRVLFGASGAAIVDVTRFDWVVVSARDTTACAGARRSIERCLEKAFDGSKIPSWFSSAPSDIIISP